jgi:NADPH:quinone reductase-like Zn-dependent oxidoreductase
MHAAVVSQFDSPPVYEEIAAPVPSDEDEVVADVAAAGLHRRVRSQADGSHYTSTGDLPLIPGVDGVGRTPDGTLRYFVLPDTRYGSMASQTVIDLRRSIVLPDGADPIALAAAMNPAMSSWVPLRRRIDFAPGQGVLILGATGNSGRLAIQVAKHLGAGRVVAAGRNPDRMGSLTALGADEIVGFDNLSAAADVDVVLDYVWGRPTADAMVQIVRGRADESRPLTWIEIGSVAGPEASIPSAALRAARLAIIGSGQGSVPARDILAELPALAAEITRGTFQINARAVPLSDVAAAWKDSDTTQRTVLVP